MVEKVGVRDFRNNIGKYIDSAIPIAVSRHGQTVGYFVPVHKAPNTADFEALRVASDKLDTLLKEHKIDKEELVQDFQKLRRGKA
ncbi:MAG: type II toxin-antitoxin system Phd/YefM family antitoxin [Cyanobacteria bacterium P01_D01_bin.36]